MKGKCTKVKEDIVLSESEEGKIIDEVVTRADEYSETITVFNQIMMTSGKSTMK